MDTRYIFLLAALACSGCRPAAEPPQSAGSRTLPTHPAISLMQVAWPSEARIDQTALAAVSPEAKAQLASAPVPVLLPSYPELASRGVMVVKEHWYSFSARHEGLT